MRRSRLPVDPYFVAGVLAVLLAGGTVAWRSRPAPPLPSLPAAVLARLDADGAGITLGSSSAPVRVSTLSDYECGGCALAHARVWPLVERYVREGAVRYTSYETPLPRHRAGLRAAVAAGCVATRSPEAFRAYHHTLYAEQARWLSAAETDTSLVDLAARSGAEPAGLRECLDREGAARAARIEQSWVVVKSGGVDFVPLWMVDGRPVNWLRLDDEIRAALRRRQPPARAEAR